MVARIKTGGSLQGAIRYNEQKVQQGKATVIAAPGYSKSPEQLSYSDKWLRLNKLALLNERVKTNCLHVSLNFHPSESFTPEKLRAIAAAYMKGIGFGGQPYLVYEHFDAAHPHVHIVTTNIQKDGQRISCHNLGKGLSASIRKRIEKDFQLVQASGRLNRMAATYLSEIQPAVYGQEESKKAVSRVVMQVMEQYFFASLPEFNAVLKGYGIEAFRGAETSRMYQKGGLVYSLINQKGERVGVPLKANTLLGKPTLLKVEAQFQRGAAGKKQFQSQVISEVSRVLDMPLTDLPQLQKALQNAGISMVLRYSDEGFLYGVSYVHQGYRCVYKGSELGKSFSASALREKFPSPCEKQYSPKTHPENNSTPTMPQEQKRTADLTPIQPLATDVLLHPMGQVDYVPYGFKKKRKRTKKSNIKL